MAAGWPPPVDVPRALLAALAATTLVALAVAGTTSAAAFGTYNPAWDGASDLREAARDGGADATIARDVDVYDDGAASSTVAVVLAPREPYSPGEAERLRRFLDRGGTLVVADDFGPHANPLLEQLGARARIDGALLRDERRFHRSPAMPVAPETGAHPLTSDVETLTLNHGSSVEPNGATVLARTSEFAYVDADRNGALDADEQVAAYPVATAEAVGDGTLVVLGDPSVFINVMLDRPGNRAFVAGLFGGHERVILDYSHAGRFPPLALALLVLRATPWLQALVGLVGLGAIAGWTVGLHREGWLDRSPTAPDADLELTEDALVAYLERRHPAWPESRVRRVVGGLMSRRGQSGGDE